FSLEMSTAEEHLQECHLTSFPADVMAHLLLYLSALDRARLGELNKRIRSVDNTIGQRQFYWVRFDVMERGLRLNLQGSGWAG
ncbi:hypothetical protein PFISCL1PPCAC_8986, partial [Pristionchus fissidentatus]